MFTSIVVILVSFIISLTITPFLRQFIIRFGIFDAPEKSRKIHDSPKPTSGGLAIYVAFIVPIMIVFFINYSSFAGSIWFPRIIGLLFTSTLILIVGFVDDVRGMEPIKKLFFQVLASILIYYCGFKIKLFTNPFGETVQLGFLGLPITIVWIVGITNAINLVDGIDGLATGVVLFASITIYSISICMGNPVSTVLIAAILGACAGFLKYNFYPATIFMGDTGSQFLGFLIGVVSIGACQKSSLAVALLTPVIVLGLPIMETLLSVGRRVKNSSSPFQADMDHVHHRLLSRGYSQRQTVYILYMICVILGIIGFIFTAARSIFAAGLLAVLAILLLLGTVYFGYFQKLHNKNAEPK
ncbi:MAG: hypothetical protein A2161_07320 [Candidatus Schekmanbacteria bacterium RBG_13_48_7]|uniref:Undecaprenyl-phosphate alpha-N-acetylglucosaminyl 1-phosphate transferase n=1 Tax=Candidatus Schekmanbacteria bacterium RBG_13_48_7 TaxID=1817878 RepID=A0A1F7S021_9BACT|nr:MAG: hypothetical protein A2161_07320 [Candidatus Schekmanbacteria bacterium RBG_13_48_7]